MAWKVKGQGKPVLEVWESFNGDLYFITEKHKDGEVFMYARLYSMPQFAEWGYGNIDYMQREYGQYKLWKVKESNWVNINTYESGLLVQDNKPVKVSASQRARQYKRRLPRMRISHSQKMQALMGGYGYSKKEAKAALEDMGE